MVASIELRLEPWASSLRGVKGRMRPSFTQERVAVSAGPVLDGLPGDGQRKTGFLKQGQSSCGVSRQDTGSAGKIKALLKKSQP